MSAQWSGNKEYTSFADTVDYSDACKDVQVLIGKNQESAGRVSLSQDLNKWVSVGSADSFCQVASVFINLMAKQSEKDAFISDHIEKWINW
ncbi:hypothetical protein VI817_004610 [Penicillium citrinum]|uniref:Polyketide synthase n=1 Tax=Penicillium hetheringtonii TaxID=911720 RepID=A0AAD6GY83_9EURO|nr:polyketide synthase [Penicillium hetheringtonii]KAK5798319.1 hypothetical protein VI817_004610 [Penicillium citrinum]